MFYKCFRFFSVAFIIDTARVNARAVAEAQDTGVKIPANRFFAFAIVRALVTPHIQRRMTRPGVQRFVKVNAECYLCECFFYLFFKILIASFIVLCSPVSWIRISFYADPNLGSRRCPYGSRSEPRRPPIMRIRIRNTGVHCFECCPYLFFKSRFVLIFFTFSCYFYKFFEFFIKVLFSCVLSSLYHI